jgi:UDP:flavonoid glycosyltransferase YjiC (YdhE family)
VRHVAFFVSGHGYGHATRASTVMAALRQRAPELHFHVFSDAPAWVFAASLSGGFTHHSARVDVGLVQHSAWEADLPATLQQLDDFLPFDPFLLRQWAAWLGQLRCELVLCDIAPLGLAVAQAADLPAILVENFTWDWIYAGYLEQAPSLARYLEPLGAALALAARRLQTEPVCAPHSTAARLPPVGRLPRASRAAVRDALGVPDAARLVLITLGGMAGTWTLPAGSVPGDVIFAVPDAGPAVQREGPILRLPHTGFYHPDLVQASDVVIAKAGYSTVAEAYQIGVPIGVVPRPSFRESDVIADFVRRERLGAVISHDDFQSGTWTSGLDTLLTQPVRPRPAASGAALAASLILECLP